MSDIRVSVQWKSSSVFAGEDVECIIIFRNVAEAHQVPQSPSPGSQARVTSSGRERWKESLPHQSGHRSVGHTRNSSISNARNPSQAISRTHKPALSLSNPHGTRQISSIPVTNTSQSRASRGHHEQHRRSISIVSLGADPPTGGYDQKQGQDSAGKRPARHARAASLQSLPYRSGSGKLGLTSAPVNGRSATLPSPLLRASTSSFVGSRSPSPNKTASTPRSVITDRDGTTKTMKSGSNTGFTNFKFPQTTHPIRESTAEIPGQANVRGATPLLRGQSPHPHEGLNGLERIIPITKVLSDTSVSGTPRSSVDFYSMSNNSTETLASEYTTHDRARQPLTSIHSRQTSLLSPKKSHKGPEVLMMGYGHITGFFTLDSSLINQSPFEEVKRKDIVGDQGGGGVVRVESSKRDSGMFGFSGWGNIGESIGGLLGGRELSSIKDTKVSSSSKNIPILSTPQSILFVDLQLRPGESRSYRYRHPMPRGIPPSHRGRAMKVTYNLVVGTQRAAKAASKLNIRHVDIPFRVLPGVNGRGDILGHDLMSPQILLNSHASISSIAETQKKHSSNPKPSTTTNKRASPEDFLLYVETMLERRRQSSGLGLLSPTEGGYRSLTPTAEEPTSMKEVIDLAILQSTTITSARKSANRFDITRSGYRVSTLMLARPAYRLGETVPVAVSFDDADIPCYAVHAMLESSEAVDPAIAIRSKASIQRVTRRVHASRTESTVFSRRVVFNPVIPMSATPSFITSGVSHEWKLRFEFITSRTKSEEDTETHEEELLEEIAPRDEKERERGKIMAGVETMACETFEVTLPLQIYGSTAAFDEAHNAGDFPI